jgi:hypothetical protein
MSNQIITTNSQTASIVEGAIIGGDLSKLSPQQRVSYYMEVCKSTGLNPLTKPFDYINLNGKLTLYARKDASEQLRRINNISIGKPDIAFQDDWIIVTVVANDDKGRTDSDVGVVSRKDMRGDFGNALMKAITKAKRRVTLSICGLGWLDETEVETIPNARPVTVAPTGEIVHRPEAEIVEELGFDVVDDEAVYPEPTPAPKPAKLSRPMDADTLYDALQRKAGTYGTRKASDKQRQLLASLLGNLFEGDNDKRHTLQVFLFGAKSLNDAADAVVLAALDWLKPIQDSGGAYVVDAMAATEARSAYHAAALDEAVNNGQQTLPIE